MNSLLRFIYFLLISVWRFYGSRGKVRQDLKNFILYFKLLTKKCWHPDFLNYGMLIFIYILDNAILENQRGSNQEILLTTDPEGGKAAITTLRTEYS